MTTKSAFNEDKVALLLGCIIFILGLGKFAGLDLLGWVVKIGMWVDSPVDAWKPATKGMMAGWQSLLATYVFVTGLLAIGVKLMPLRGLLHRDLLHRHRLLHRRRQRLHRC